MSTGERHATTRTDPQTSETVSVVDGTTVGPEPELLNQRETARFLRVDVDTLRRWAINGKGPKFVQFGRGFVRYRRTDLDRWLDEHSVTTTTSR